MSTPPFDLVKVEASTRVGMDAGHRIFQVFRYGPSDMAHVGVLLGVFDLPVGSVVVDVGCGIGEVSRLMACERRDLRFVLVNISPLQLSLCPWGRQFERLLGDWHVVRLPAGAGAWDAVMFSSALVQMDEELALERAFAVLRPGGVLLVNEPVRLDGDGVEMERLLACRVLTRERLLGAIEGAGFTQLRVVCPAHDAAHFRALLRAEGLERLLDGVYPLIVRAVK